MLMANYRGHTVGGGVAGGLTLVAFYGLTLGDIPNGGTLLADWQLIVAALVLAFLFGLFPDVDTNSKAQNLFFGVAFTADILLILTENYQAAAFLGLLAMTPILSKHRGWTHSKLAALLVPIPILIIPYLSTNQIGDSAILLYAASVAGYFSHLLLDGLVVKRIKIKGGW